MKLFLLNEDKSFYVLFLPEFLIILNWNAHILGFYLKMAIFAKNVRFL